MLRMTRKTLVRKNLFTLTCAIMFSFSCKCANLALLLNFSGDDSELHVIIFDEIDAICKVHDYIKAAVNVDIKTLMFSASPLIRESRMSLQCSEQS